MRKSIVISILILTAAGCKDSTRNAEFKSLQNRVKELQQENIVLKDSLSTYEKRFLYSQMLIGIPDGKVIRVNKKNNISIFFQTLDKTLPMYDIYKIENGNEFKVGSNNKTKFDFEFIPKSIDDNKVDLVVKLPYKGEMIEFSAEMFFEVEK